jgi:hypothetical protein
MWHQDGPHEGSEKSLLHLAPHALNVFIPLVDITIKNGPTEFKPTTHIKDNFDAAVHFLAPTSIVLFAHSNGIMSHHRWDL